MNLVEKNKRKLGQKITIKKEEKKEKATKL